MEKIIPGWGWLERAGNLGQGNNGGGQTVLGRNIRSKYIKPRNTQRSIIVKSRNKTKKSKNLVIRETKVQTTSHKLMPGTSTKQNSLQYPISEGEKSDSNEAT